VRKSSRRSSGASIFLSFLKRCNEIGLEAKGALAILLLLLLLLLLVVVAV
jgi:hypothetical protein